MLDLTKNLADLLQARLNKTDALAAWTKLLAGEEFAGHRDREQRPYDTTCSDFHRAARRTIDDQLESLRHELVGARPAGSALLGRWLACVDAFALGAANEQTDDWVKAHVAKRPLTAVRVGATVFYLSGQSAARWQRRPWQGTDTDPLMTLPYQRKYDRERHGLADLRLRGHYERLHVAADLLTVLAERLEGTDTRASDLAWPELANIQSELESLDLSLGADSLSALGGRFCLELCALGDALEPSADGSTSPSRRAATAARCAPPCQQRA